MGTEQPRPLRRRPPSPPPAATADIFCHARLGRWGLDRSRRLETRRGAALPATGPDKEPAGAEPSPRHLHTALRGPGQSGAASGAQRPRWRRGGPALPSSPWQRGPQRPRGPSPPGSGPAALPRHRPLPRGSRQGARRGGRRS